MERARAHKRNEDLDDLLQELSHLLTPVECEVTKQFSMPKYPVVLVLGAPRSGTTLMMQWLAGTGAFAYPSNLLSRFYSAPYIGAKIQLLLTDPDYRFKDEIEEFSFELGYSSELGKTRGILSPNGFWYFWRRFCPAEDSFFVSESMMQQFDRAAFTAEMAALEAAFNKPLAMKGMMYQCYLDKLNQMLDKVIFVFIKRHPLYTMQSLLASRLEYYGDMSQWYSFKPLEYESLQGLNPYQQTAGQVFYLNRTIENGLKDIDGDRQLTVTYEDFCEKPGWLFEQLMEKLACQGYEMKATYTGPERFQQTNQVRTYDKEQLEKIEQAYKSFSGDASIDW